MSLNYELAIVLQYTDVSALMILKFINLNSFNVLMIFKTNLIFLWNRSTSEELHMFT